MFAVNGWSVYACSALRLSLNRACALSARSLRLPATVSLALCVRCLGIVRRLYCWLARLVCVVVFCGGSLGHGSEFRAVGACVSTGGDARVPRGLRRPITLCAPHVRCFEHNKAELARLCVFGGSA